jgi:hypothetical protein
MCIGTTKTATINRRTSMENQKKTSKKGAKKNTKIGDLKPQKDAKGGYWPQKPDGSL